MDVVLDAADFGKLLPLGHVVVDEAQAAVERHGDGHARFRHGVHVRRNDRDIEVESFRKLRVELRVPREHLRIKRRQGDIVIRQAEAAVGREKRVGRLVEPGIDAVGLFGCCHVGKCRLENPFGKRRIIGESCVPRRAPWTNCRASDKVVAQIFNLLYRRFATCRAPQAFDALPISNRRYSRLQICATSQGLALTLSLALGPIALWITCA